MRYFLIAAGFALVAATASFSSSPAQAADKAPIMANGRCWINTNGTNYHWGDCPVQKAEKETHHKGKKG